MKSVGCFAELFSGLDGNVAMQVSFSKMFLCLSAFIAKVMLELRVDLKHVAEAERG